MTRLVDVPTMSALIQRLTLPCFIGELADTIQADFMHWPAFDKSPRVASQSKIGVIELMPVSGERHYAFKYVNGYPGNPARGFYTVMAFGVQADVDTGYPLLLSEVLARPNCTPTSCAGPRSLSNTSRRPASKAISSACLRRVA